MSKQDKKLAILIIIVWIIYFGGIFIATRNKKIVDNNYIQNLEEKLNIYEEDYDRFCLEDSLRQMY
jgi:hypothetical protein